MTRGKARYFFLCITESSWYPRIRFSRFLILIASARWISVYKEKYIGKIYRESIGKPSASGNSIGRKKLSRHQERKRKRGVGGRGEEREMQVIYIKRKEEQKWEKGRPRNSVRGVRRGGSQILRCCALRLSHIWFYTYIPFLAFDPPEYYRGGSYRGFTDPRILVKSWVTASTRTYPRWLISPRVSLLALNGRVSKQGCIRLKERQYSWKYCIGIENFRKLKSCLFCQRFLSNTERVLKK